MRVGTGMGLAVLLSLNVLSNAAAAAADTEPVCGTANKAPELVDRGDAYRDVGLDRLRDTGFAFFRAGWAFLYALECYGRALLIAPDSYKAKLGLGVAYLGLAQTEQEQSTRRAALLVAAKRNLGEAYMLRWGFHEPLYYLGEIAMLEQRYDLARQFFDLLLRAGYKRGPVNVAMGYMAERQQGFAVAKPYYEAALLAGWPASSVVYARTRLETKHETTSK